MNTTRYKYKQWELMFTLSFVSKRATAVCHTLTLKGGLVQPSRRGSDTAHCGTASITPVPHSVELLLLSDHPPVELQHHSMVRQAPRAPTTSIVFAATTDLTLLASELTSEHHQPCPPCH